jgi:hypothetical protein
MTEIPILFGYGNHKLGLNLINIDIVKTPKKAPI